MKIVYKTRLVTTPIPRHTPVPYLKKNSDKVMLWEDFIIEVFTTPDSDPIVINVEKGYVTDGSTIPRFFWRLYTPFYTHARWASAVHDYMYTHLYTNYSKKFADELFREMMIHDGASKFTAGLFYRSVRLNIWGGNWDKLGEDND